LDLRKTDDVTRELQKRVQPICTAAALLGEVVSCDIGHDPPDNSLLGWIKAGKFDAVFKYFEDGILQAALVAEQPELAKKEAEALRIRKGQEVTDAKTEFQIHELDKQEEVKVHDDKLKSKGEEREKAALDRNSRILKYGADLEFNYKKDELGQDVKLAEVRLALAQLKAKEDDCAREAKVKDADVEVGREEKLSKIRAAEKASLFTTIGTVVDKVAAMPNPKFENVRTVVNPGNSATDLVLGMLSTMIGGAVEGEAKKGAAASKG